MHLSSRDFRSFPTGRLRHPVMAACVLAAAVALTCPRTHAATFAEQKATVRQALESQPESAIISLLEAGIAGQQPAQAAAVATEWLKHNLPENPQLLRHLGRCAELASDWREAAAFYQQFLKQADPKTDSAAEAITATYTLLLDQLDDIEAAYTFGHREAGALAVNPRFRQFDRWFLDTARQRLDLEAVTDRLLATAQSGVGTDHMIAFHSNDLVWLLSEIGNTRLDQKSQHFDKTFVTHTLALAETLDFNPELQLLLTWKVSVKAYLMDRIDGRDTEAPLDAARSLLEKFPIYARMVQTDWAGGSNSSHYRDDPSKYWPHQLAGKLPPIHKALEKLSELEQANLLETWSKGYYQRGPEILTPEEAQGLVLHNPKLVNRRSGPTLNLPWGNQVTVEEAKKIAPSLEYNPTPIAALIRTIASTGESKDYDQMMDHLLTREVWRLGPEELSSRYAETLWNWAGKPGGNAKLDQQIKRSRQIASSIPDPKSLVNVPAAQRLTTFRKLWKEYTSPRLRTPYILPQIENLLAITPDAMADLLNDTSLDARLLAEKMLNTTLTDAGKAFYNDHGLRTELKTDSYDPIIERLAERNGGLTQLRQNKDRYQPYPLLPAVDNALRRQLQGKTLDSWLVTAWLNARFPENDEQDRLLMQQLLKSPAWKSLPLLTRNGAQVAYPDLVLTPTQNQLRQQREATAACASLLALKENPTAKDLAKALNTTSRALLDAPTRITPVGLEPLAKLDDTLWAEPEFTTAVVDFIDRTRLTTPYREFGDRIISLAGQDRDPATILRLTPYIWTNVQAWHRPLPTVMQLSSALAAKHPEAASALARAGLHTIARHKHGHTWFKIESDIPALKTIRGKTAMQLGLVEIPVPSNHPQYPVYLSQAEWMTDNIDTAWKLLDANWETFLAIHRELTQPYTMWVMERCIANRNSTRQQQLIEPLLEWINEATSALRPAEKAAIEIAYGDIAMQRGQIREALGIFKRVEDRESYQDIPARHQATLRRVRALRIAKDFDNALEALGELELDRIPGLWTEIRFARAEVHYDMEEFDDTQDDINSILNREPNHPDARILLGKVQLKRQKLMEATEVELGSTSSQQSLVPGEKLKVTLSDPTLAVSGAGTEIEVAVWTTTGDREQFFLRQFGDQKTKFRGEIATALGAPAPGDGILQVIGDDEVYYAYSDRFLEKMNQPENKRGGPIRVASNGLLMASARKLLSEAEQRRADMQAVMEKIQTKSHRNAEAAARAELARRATEDDTNPLERYLSNVAKPGNPIHIRVIDPDRSRTAGIDELTVSVDSTSGDSISRVTLRETDTHSGWFEGSVTTTSASARAIARNSEPGRNPNMVISGNPEYPAWRPIPDENQTPEFTIDLNDRVNLGELHLSAREPGFALNKFIVQTAPRHGSWTTVASHPSTQLLITDPWQPSITVVNEAGRNAHYGARPVTDLSDLRQHLDSGWMAEPDMAVARNVAGPTEALPASIPTDIKWLRSQRFPNPAVVFRFQAHFHEAAEITRHFQLKLGRHNPKNSGIPAEKYQLKQKAQYLLAVNGRPISNPKEADIAGSLNLKAGIHTFEIWATGWLSHIGFGREVTLLTRSSEDQPWESCSDKFFDPQQFPDDSRDHRNRPATITPEDNGKSFAIRFAKDSSTRLIRFLFVDQEGPVPAVNKITLTDANGGNVLPLEQDFAKLNKNDTLEILTGDRISIRYQDDRFVTEEKQRQERFLQVSFTDAQIEFADTKPRFSSKHNKEMPYYEELLRFAHDQPISLVVRDADMDSTVEADRIPVTLSSKTGGTATFTATETGESTGVFQVLITPVSGKPARPDEFQVAAGGRIHASYLDEENNRPGVPSERLTKIEHAAYTQPQFVIGHASVSPWQPEPGQESMTTLRHGFDPIYQTDENTARKQAERIRPRWQIDNQMLPATEAPENGFQVVHGQPMFVELVAPQYAIGMASTVTLYAQSDRSRSAAAKDSPFDINAPGTIKLTGRLSTRASDLRHWFNSPSLASYHNQSPWSSTETIDTDRFRISIPVIAGVLPNHGVLSENEIEEMTQQDADTRQSAKELIARGHSLVAQAGERIHIGFEFTAPDGKRQWLTTSARVTTHPAFDIMDEAYHSAVQTAYAGESLHLRVVDLGADTSNDIDQVRVLMQAKSGSKHYMTLRESGPHTGIFRDDVVLSYQRKPQAASDAEIDIAREGFPITYGDTIAARYTDTNGTTTDTHYIAISKGADGSIAPFSKQYEDEEVAMRTQFSLAEAYLEMAKRHRQLGQDEMAEREYASAKLLLSKAMDQFTEPDTRAHAEYLLGMLTMEEAIATPKGDLRETRFRAALSRFMNVTGSYSLSLHASRAQYRIASIYEQLGEPEIAAQEYVKLAYKYPDSEFLATSMAKLGTHFLKMASSYEQQAKPLLERAEDDKDAAFEGEALQKLAQREYLKTASIFSRLQQRFPGNHLAGPAGLRSGQAYMRAKHFRDAIRMFNAVIAEQGYDGPDVRAQAMYWVGMCHQQTRSEMAAYSMFKRLTYDFPESKWAAYARAQLSQEQLLNLENRLELERLEAGQ